MRKAIGIVLMGVTALLLLAQPACLLVADTDCEDDSHCKSGNVCRDGECVSGSGNGGEGNGGSSFGGSSSGGSGAGEPPPCPTDCINPASPLICCRPGNYENSTCGGSTCPYSPCCG